MPANLIKKQRAVWQIPGAAEIYDNIAGMPQTRLTAILLSLLLAACAPQASARPVDSAAAQVSEQTATAQVATIQAEAVATLFASMPTATKLPTATPTVTATPTGSATKTPTLPAAQAPAARTQYRLNVDFNYPQRSGQVNGEILYTNSSSDTLTDLLLTVELQSFPSASFSMSGLWWTENSQPVETAAWDGINIRIPLRQPLRSGQQVGLKYTYRFLLPPQSALGGDRPLPIGYTSRQANLVDWYPYIPPYQAGQGWLTHPPSYYGEHLVYDLADFDVRLRVSDAPQNVLVAASGPALREGEAWRYRMQAARSFAISIGSEYQVETAKVGQVTVSSYFFPLHGLAGKQVLKTTAESLKLYEELFGPYPHDTLAVVEADFLDGMEYDGLYFLSRAFYNLYKGAPADYLITIAAHETAHQWWFGLVGSDQASQPWLDEALSTYSERIFFERLYPQGLDWWWAYRIRYERPAGWVDSTVYPPQGGLQSYRDYRNAVYLNGALFLEELRQAAGDEAFFAFLKEYTARYAGKIAFQKDFFAVFQRHSDADIQPLLKKYFAQPEVQ